MRSLFSVFLAATLLTPVANAQNWAPELREKFASTISAEDMKAHLSFLAHDELEGRETGERGQRIASLYIRSTFMKAGLPGGGQNGSYFQPYQVKSTTIHEATFTSGKKQWVFPNSFFFSFGSGPVSEASFKGWSFVAGQNPGEEDVTGKLALVLPRKGGSNLFESYRMWEALSQEWLDAGAGAVAIILSNKDFRSFQRYANRRSQELAGTEEVASRPVFYFSETMAAELIGLAKGDFETLKTTWPELTPNLKLNYGKAPLSYKADIETSAIEAANVLAFLEGTEKPEEVVVITGHYDHIGIVDGEINNGADDDASGTTGVLEIAEAFARAAAEGSRPRRSILFMTVSGEEKGLWGSEFYSENPIYPIANTVANFNIDMIGRIGDEYLDSPDSLHYVYLIGSDRLSTDLHKISERVNGETQKLKLDYKYNDPKDPNRFYFRSDHYNFARKGIPVIFYFNGTHDDYHQPTDDIEKIQFGKMARVARLVFSTAWEVANQEARIVVDGEVEEE